MLTRRHFVLTTTALFSTPISAPAIVMEDVAEVAPAVRAPVSNEKMWSTWGARITPTNFDPAISNPWGLHRRFLPVQVEARDRLIPSGVHVDAVARYLYHNQEASSAMRYGVAIARGNLYEPGTYTIKRKRKWPTWRPTDAMIEREPNVYGRFADGDDGGPTPPSDQERYIYLMETETLT